ncbi:Ig-like domain-containing protein [Sporocytophaga myxococcoides]|uniref:Ig-like domain-containing protein n=1 Tax=Sporocytophaga myxococcoides TaxID=153721 RepID=UPI0003FAEB68|nr:Ig-like domain-containing protein [Sporocytophaga myxococcoides]
MKFQASLILLICTLLSIFDSLSAQDCGCDFTLQANGKVLSKGGVEITLTNAWTINAIDIKIKPGNVFCFKNIQYSKGIIISNFAGTESQPIIIKNCGGQTVIDTREYGVIFRNSKHFKFLGNGDPSVKYGFKVTARNKNNFFLDAKDFTTNFEIAYIEVAGASMNPTSDTAGFAGIGAKTNPLCDGSAERGVWTMYNPIIHDNYIHNTGGEGIYMGYGWYKEKSMTCPCENDPSTSCTILVHSHSIVGARVYNNITENTGFDGIQIKNTDQDCEVYNNIIRNYGLRNEESQNEGLLLGEGTTGKAYNNWIENGTGNGIQNHAMGNQDIFNNVVINPQEYGFVCWDGPAVVRVGYYNFFNNTIINAGLDGFNFFGPGGGPKRVYNNIIAKVGAGRNLLKRAGEVVLFEESNNYLTNNIEDVKFISATAPYNIHLQSISPAIDKGKDLTSFGITKDFDLAPRPSGVAFDIGAFEFGNIPPIVKITQPLNNAVFAPGSIISIKADASDPDGLVSKVEFYNGTTKLGEDLTSPYSIDWSASMEGTYTIKVIATDNGGSTASSTITIVVKNALPAITITKPLNNSSTAAGKAINIEANATDSDGSVTKVEFYYTINNKDTILIGSSIASPYQVSWTPLTTGTYKIIVKATDNNGGISKAAITVTVTNTLPTISIVAPTNNSSFPFASDVEFKVNAMDADGTITKVEYFNGLTKIGESTTASFSFIWKNIPLGTYTITAKATDNIGATATSLPIQFSITNTPPVVNIIAPLNNAKFSPGPNITLEATATDEDGIVTKVEFFYNNTNLLGSDNTVPYSINWNNVPEGSYTITARATDNAGAISTKTINITVVNNLPTVKITSPANLSVYETDADIEITAEALDIDGSISKVVFYNGTTILGEDLNGPYSYIWENVQNGTYSISAVAYDNLGKQNVSAAIKIIVNVTTNIPPEVTIINPVDNQTLTPGDINFEVNATDVDGNVVLVELFNGSSKIGESTSLPYTFNWTNLTEGVYVITAKATDNDNETNTSAPITITIYNAPPVVTIISPANNQAFDSDDQVLINTTIADTDGNISKVEFFLNDALIGSATTAPYNLALNKLPSGTYNITVKATDNLSKEDSETIQITVSNKLPSISITTPVSGTTFNFSEPIVLNVNANDPDGSIKNVEYYINGVLTTTRSYPDFSFTWADALIGDYEIVAFATDNNGAKVASVPILISVGKRPVTVSLISPEINSTYEFGSAIDFSANVTDPDNAVVKIEFYANNIKIGESPAPEYQYTWSNSTSGNFEVYAVVLEGTGKRDTSNKVVININNPNKLPVITITSPGSNTTYSYCSDIQLAAASTDEDGIVTKVEFSVNDQVIGTDLSAPYTITVRNLDPGSNTITATAYDNKGGESNSSISISVIETPVVTFDIQSGKDTFKSGSGITIQTTTLDSVYFLNTSDLNPLQVKAFEWSLSDGTTSEEKFLAHNFIQGGLYKAVLILTDINGCEISQEVQVLVKDTALQARESYWVPNALSPYETNPENKVIKVYGKLAPEDFSFTIYSRWGQVLYSTTNLAEAKNIGWDGDNAPMDTYTYVLKGKEDNGNKVEKSGTITLIR